MAITVSGTQITFNDATVQTTAFTGGGPTGAFTGMQAFNSPGTFTAPANTSNIYIVAVSGGGGGGGMYVDNTPGAFGGGGALAALVTAVTPNTSYPVTVGNGGNAGSVYSGTGGAGNATSIGNLLTCNGGAGGAGSNGPTPPPGAPGNAPLANTSAPAGVRSDIMSSSVLISLRAGAGGTTNDAGIAGKVLIYF